MNIFSASGNAKNPGKRMPASGTRQGRTCFRALLFLIILSLAALSPAAYQDGCGSGAAFASERTKTLPGGQVVPINEVLYPSDARMPSSGGVSLEMMENAWKHLSEATGFDAFVWYDDDDTVNAYITKDEDGDFKVVVFRGLLDVLRSEDEIAGVLAHEIGHGINGHLEEGVAQATGVVVAANVLSHILGGGALGDAAIGIGANLAVQGYSREQEVEADDCGVEFAFKAGYSPWSLYDSILRMADAGLVTPPSGFNSHPPTERRMTRLRSQAERWEKEKPGARPAPSPVAGAQKTSEIADAEPDKSADPAPAAKKDTPAAPAKRPAPPAPSAGKSGFNPNASEDVQVIATYPISQGEQNTLSILHRNGTGKFSAGRYKDAYAAFKRAAESWDGDYLDAYWAGKTALKMGKKKEAKTWLDRALAINPDYAPAKKLKSRHWK